MLDILLLRHRLSYLTWRLNVIYCLIEFWYHLLKVIVKNNIWELKSIMIVLCQDLKMVFIWKIGCFYVERNFLFIWPLSRLMKGIDLLLILLELFNKWLITKHLKKISEGPEEILLFQDKLRLLGRVISIWNLWNKNKELREWNLPHKEQLLVVWIWQIWKKIWLQVQLEELVVRVWQKVSQWSLDHQG